MPALSYLIATLVFGGTWPMLGLIFWNVLIAANSPDPGHLRRPRYPWLCVALPDHLELLLDH